MSRWSDQFQVNPIHQAISQLKDWLATDPTDIDSMQQSEKRRLDKGLNTIGEIIAGIDPEFYPEVLVNQLYQNLSGPPVWNNLKAYSENPITQYLREANEGITAVAPVVFQLAALARHPKARDVVKSIEELNDNFVAKVGEQQKDFSSKINLGLDKIASLEAQINSLVNEYSAFRQGIENALSNWQEKYTDAQTNRAEEFSKIQIERSTRFDDLMRELSLRANTVLTELSDEQKRNLQKAFESYSAEVDSMMTDMDKKHQAIREIHGLVGTDGVAGGYKKGATDEQSAANFWRWISFGSLGVAAIWIFVKYLMGFELTLAGQVNWPELATAASLTLVLLGASGYAARQSKLHRETEQHMRWFALEVNAIDPFLSSLPSEQQNELKNQLVQKLFGQNRLTADQVDANIDPAALKSLSGLLDSIFKYMGRT